MRASVLAIAGLLASLLPAPAASAQQMDLQLWKIARRPAAVEPVPKAGPAAEEARQAARRIRLEQERAGPQRFLPLRPSPAVLSERWPS